MDKKTLKQYRALIREIALEDKALERLYSRLESVPVVMGKVESSMEEFPFIRTHIPVEVPEPKEAQALRRRITIKEQRLEMAERLAGDIERFIAGIPDSTDRQIFELAYLDGKPQREIATVVHLEQSQISRRISAVLKDA